MPRRKRQQFNPSLSLLMLAVFITLFAFNSGDTTSSLITGMLCGAAIAVLFAIYAALKWNNRRIQQQRYNAWLNEQRRIDQLLALSPAQFEQRIAQVFRKRGYKAAVVGQSGDDGIDIRVRTRTGENWIVQCKRYAPENKVGSPVLRDLAGAMLHENADRAILITTSSFTEPARRWAEGHKIVLVDGRRLVRWIAKSSKTDDRPSRKTLPR